MAGKKVEPQREARIVEQIIVDAYTEEERALSWYYYLEKELRFPFDAECAKQRAISPLRKGEKIQLPALAPEGDCAHEILVLGRWGGRSLGVPLAHLKITGRRKLREIERLLFSSPRTLFNWGQTLIKSFVQAAWPPERA